MTRMAADVTVIMGRPLAAVTGVTVRTVVTVVQQLLQLGTDADTSPCSTRQPSVGRAGEIGNV